MKLIVTERETRALRAYLREHPVRLTSRVATVEVARAVARHRAPALGLLRTAFAGVGLIELNPEIAAAAGSLAPETLRTLDAIHVASALSLSGDLAAFVSYDARQTKAAAAAGLRVASPA